MQGYLRPAILLLMGLGLWLVQDSVRWADVSVAAMLVYGVGAVWWAVTAIAAPPPILRHLLAAWLPVAPLALALAWIEVQTGFDGPGAVATLVLLPLVVVVVLASAVATMMLAWRKA